nr:SBBP repeat-containing protein [Bacteroidota bacterium]
MKKLLLSFLISGASLLTITAQINIQWQTRYTSAGSNVDRAEDLVMDASGNVYVTGLGLGASGNFDYVTIKYDPAGAQVWKSEYNGPGNSLDEAHAIVVDGAGNVYVTGWSFGGAGTGYDYATVKYNSAGV